MLPGVGDRAGTALYRYMVGHCVELLRGIGSGMVADER